MSSDTIKKLTFGLKLKARKFPSRKENEMNKDAEKNDKKRKNVGDEVQINKKAKLDVDIEPEKVKPKKKPLSLEKLAQINKEKIAHLRNQNNIHVFGTDMPDPISSFEQFTRDYKLPEYFLENLNNVNMKRPTPVQMQAITAVLQNRNVMVCAPTGSGKTLAFSLPLLHCLETHKSDGFRVIVLVPTRELAKQIQQEMIQIAAGSPLKIRFLLKSKTVEDRQTWMSADILITTPKKLVYAIKKYSIEINLTNVQYLVVDESDKLFEDGETGFRDQLAIIYKKCQSKSLRTLLFSATFSQEVEEWCHNNLDDLLQIYVGAINSASQTIDQKLVYVGNEAGKLIALRNIFREGFSAPVLIFTQSKQRSEELFHELSFDGLNVEVIHSEKSDSQRDGIVERFRMGKIWILICSDVMARGIDFKEVNLVINYDFPTSTVSYIHRIGRTGRAGKPGKAITFFTNEDATCLKLVVNLMRQSGCEVPEYMLKLKRPPKKLVKMMSKKAPKRKPISKDSTYKKKNKRNLRKMSSDPKKTQKVARTTK